VAPIQKDSTIFISKAMKIENNHQKQLIDTEPDVDLEKFFGEAEDIIEVDLRGA